MEQRVDAMRVGMETWRKQFDPANPSAEILNVVQSFQSLLQACTAQASQIASTVSNDAAGNPFAQMLQAIPLGHSRERQVEWQAYVKALADYQQIATNLMQQFANVVAESLKNVPDLVAQRSQSGKTVESMRELYEIWIECGEQCFAAISRDDQFVAVQAAHTNALSRVRLAERTLLERWLQQYDLPTRSEINALHQKVRGMAQHIAELEARLADKPAVVKRSKKTS